MTVARQRGTPFVHEKTWAEGVVPALDHAAPTHERAEPLTVPGLRRPAEAADTKDDRVLVLSGWQVRGSTPPPPPRGWTRWQQ